MKTYRFVLKLYGWLVVIGISYLVIMAGSVEDVEADWAPSPDQVRAELLMADNDCWTGSGPEGVIPGHAVVDIGNGPEVHPSEVGFGIWLDGDPGTLFAFCP